MPLDACGQMEAERFRYRGGGVGFFPKSVFKLGLKPHRRRAAFRPLTDGEVNQFLKAGFRVNDKHRGIYVHI
jgi:hypothetical protein